jgi:hypothetical protein
MSKENCVPCEEKKREKNARDVARAFRQKLKLIAKTEQLDAWIKEMEAQHPWLRSEE